jgi:hypothetical protein
MDKSTRAVPRTQPGHIAHGSTTRARRRPTGAPNRKAVPPPRITRLGGDIDLVVPRDCSASVVLKLVARDDGHRYYAWWLIVGRHDQDTISVHYKYSGEDTIRCDLPDGNSLSAKSLQPFLAAYLASDGTEPPDTPIIID